MLTRLLFILLLPLTLFSEGSERGFYVGVGSGFLLYGDAGLLKKEFHVEHKASGLGYYKLYGGYQLHRVIAIELSAFSYQVENSKNSYNYKAKGMFLGPNIGLTFADRQVRLFALPGLSILSLKHENVPEIPEKSQGVLALHIGIGLTYEPQNFYNLAFRLALENDFTETYIDSREEAVPYSQNLSQMYLGLEYKFSTSHDQSDSLL